MNIRHPKTVKAVARQRLSQASQRKQILAIFCAILLALCLAMTALSALLDSAMSRSGGLGNLGTRSILSTIQTILPFANTLALMILELGLLAAMLRISRGQFTSPQTLRMGLARFFPMLRCVLLQAMMYVALGFALTNVAMVIFFLTPFSKEFMAILTPMAMTSTPEAIMETMMTDEVLLLSLFDAVLPMYVISFLLILAAVIPISYRLRLANFVLLDEPRAGAFRALFESIRMTRRNWLAFVKMDLSYWWYYILLFLSSALNYGYILISLLGIQVPLNDDLLFYGSYALYLITQVAIYYFLRPQVQVSTALIYNALRPREEKGNGVVLGNIFQM